MEKGLLKNLLKKLKGMSVRFDFNENIIRNEADQIISDKLTVIGAFISSKASELAPVDLGFLRNSITFSVDLVNKKTRISANTEYAAIQELGGEIKPVDAQALAIPVHPDAKGKSPSDFDDLFMIKRAERAPLLVRKKGRGNNHERLDIMFVLVKKVYIPAQPYLRPAVLNNKSKIMEILGD